MNPFIKEQLNLVSKANLPYYDDNTTQIIIPKIEQEKVIQLDVNHYYIIELADYILNPPENFTLHTNWNNNNVPKYKYMKCIVKVVMGKMVRIEGTACNMKDMSDIDYKWAGWLPSKSIKVIKEML